MNCNFRLAAVLLMAAFLGACSAGATVNTKTPKAVSIPSKSVVALQVKAVGEKDEDTEEVVQKIRSGLFGHLVSDGLFKQVVNEAEPADYRLSVDIDGVRSVSQGARIFLGVLAGENKLTAHCHLKNAADDSSLAEFDVAGASAAHPLSSENDMDDAIEKVIAKIITALH